VRSGSTSSRTSATGREDFAFYIGIDLGDKDSDVCVLDQRGEVSDEAMLCCAFLTGAGRVVLERSP